jgi:hypothetical protein
VGTSTITAAEGEAAGHVEFDFAVGGLIWSSVGRGRIRMVLRRGVLGSGRVRARS